MVRAVLTPEELERGLRMFDADICALTNGVVKPSDESTFGKWADYFPSHNMMMRVRAARAFPRVCVRIVCVRVCLAQHHAAGQSESAWWLRTHPAVADVFARLWRVPPTDLVGSTCSVSFYPAPEAFNGDHDDAPARPARRRVGRGWYRGSAHDWFHTDQGPHNGDDCIQGLVALTESSADDATLHVLVGSHLHWEQFFVEFPPAAAVARGDMHRITTAEQVRSCVCVPVGRLTGLCLCSARGLKPRAVRRWRCPCPRAA